MASKSAGTLRAYLHRTCGKHALPGLLITEGPKSTERCDFYRRQCCRVPLPELKDAQDKLALYEEAAAAAVTDPTNPVLKAKAEKLLTAATQTALELGYSVADMRECLDCLSCGWDVCMPKCPLEWDDTKSATFKKYETVLQTNGVSVASELREVKTTRKGLMEHRAPPPLHRSTAPPLHHSTTASPLHLAASHLAASHLTASQFTPPHHHHPHI